MWLVVGLGNPGSQYRNTRHNVGFMVAAELLLSGKAPAPPRVKLGAEIAECTIGGHKTLLCKPMEFMNVSGQAVARVAKFWKIAPANTVVVHDDLDLPFGQLRIAPGGGHGGHNGLRSIIAECGTPDFCRVRVGIDRPPSGHDPAAYVLQGFSSAQNADLPDVIVRAAEAVAAILTNGVPAAMNKFNARKKTNT